MKINFDNIATKEIGERTKIKQIVVISRDDDVLYRMLEERGYKVKKEKSAFEFLENTSKEEIENSLVIAKSGIIVPEELRYIEYKRKEELNIIMQIETNCEVEKTQYNREKEKNDILHHRVSNK